MVHFCLSVQQVSPNLNCVDPDSYSDFGMQILIHKAAKYESNLVPDLDPQHWFKNKIGLRVPYLD